MPSSPSSPRKPASSATGSPKSRAKTSPPNSAPRIPASAKSRLAARASGHAWDDSANTNLLNAFFQLDLAARHDFGEHWTASAILNNLLNQRPDVARTPILTLGSPFLAQGGLAFHWSGAAGH